MDEFLVARNLPRLNLKEKEYIKEIGISKETASKVF